MHRLMPHLKEWTPTEKEVVRRAFEEGSRQRTLAMQRQQPFTHEEMVIRLRQTRETVISVS
jgi:hypothetical protein